METTIYWAKVRDTAIIPTKKDGDAGYDIYANFEQDYMMLNPFETRLIPTGIATRLDDGYYFQIEERGSTGSKGIKKSAGVIDSSYSGEWFIAITNCNDKPLVITKEENSNEFLSEDYIVYPYSKAIAQAVLHRVPKATSKVITYEELKNIPTDRGDGALGSSGK